MTNVVVDRYAEALFLIGEEDNKIESLYNELKEIASLMATNKELSNVMRSPLVSKSEKISIIDKLFLDKIDDDLRNFLKILVEKGRISSIKEIEAKYKSLFNEKNNIVEGYVISAVPMDELEIKELEGELSRKYNKNITLENKVDKDILGGVLVKIGNTELDGTIKTRLNNMKNQLSQVI